MVHRLFRTSRNDASVSTTGAGWGQADGVVKNCDGDQSGLHEDGGAASIRRADLNTHEAFRKCLHHLLQLSLIDVRPDQREMFSLANKNRSFAGAELVRAYKSRPETSTLPLFPRN